MSSAALAQQMADHEAAPEIPTEQLTDPGHALYLAVSTLAAGDTAFTLLERYETRHTRAYERAARSLMLYRKFRQDDPAPTATEQFTDTAIAEPTPEPVDAPAAPIAVESVAAESAAVEPVATPQPPAADSQTRFCQTNPGPASAPNPTPTNPDKSVPNHPRPESPTTDPDPENRVKTQ